jgi:CRISPR/Cas system-associated exonuclease Cas4 (RecB family)
MDKRVDYLSISQLKQFLYCPVAYFKIYYEGAEQMPPNIYMIYGIAIHEALALNFRQKIESKNDLSADILKSEFNSVVERECTKHNLQMPIDMLTDGYFALDYYMEHVAPKIQPIKVEENFKIKLKNYPITIMGYIDLIEEKGLVIDHKSAGKSWRRTWNQPIVNKDIQLTLYAVAYRKLFKKRELGVGIDILPRDKQIPYHRIITTRTDAQIKELLELMTNMEKICQLGVFAPNMGGCKDCPFKDTCTKQVILNK